MTRTLLMGAAALAVVALAAPAALASPPQLVGTVGPRFTIVLTKGGKKVTKLPAGTYVFVVKDRSSMHSFGLDGPNGFAKDFTSVSFMGTKTFTVKLKPGSYKFYCSPHEATMFGRFTVAGAGRGY